LCLALALGEDLQLHGEAFNFGPQPREDYSVLELVEEMSIHWDKAIWRDVANTSNKYYETTLLRLNCKKALSFLDWQATMNFKETIKMTAEWYQSFYSKSDLILDITNKQIEKYISLAESKGIQWAQ
jgi:CDP-glucose 4,6-dehydratase